MSHTPVSLHMLELLTRQFIQILFHRTLFSYQQHLLFSQCEPIRSKLCLTSAAFFTFLPQQACPLQLGLVSSFSPALVSSFLILLKLFPAQKAHLFCELQLKAHLFQDYSGSASKKLTVSTRRDSSKSSSTGYQSTFSLLSCQ